MTTTRSCAYCQNAFLSRRETHRFCSPYCRERDWGLKHRVKHNEAVRRYRAKRYQEDGRWTDSSPKASALKAWMNEIKSKPRADCGGSFEVCCMDFDHRDGTEKAYNVGSMFAHHYSRELIETELAKCDLVCANCHRIRTRDRRTGNGRHRVCRVP